MTLFLPLFLPLCLSISLPPLSPSSFHACLDHYYYLLASSHPLSISAPFPLNFSLDLSFNLIFNFLCPFSVSFSTTELLSQYLYTSFSLSMSTCPSPFFHPLLSSINTIRLSKVSHCDQSAVVEWRVLSLNQDLCLLSHFWVSISSNQCSV